jgi:hypothetical protein
MELRIVGPSWYSNYLTGDVDCHIPLPNLPPWSVEYDTSDRVFILRGNTKVVRSLSSCGFTTNVRKYGSANVWELHWLLITFSGNFVEYSIFFCLHGGSVSSIDFSRSCSSIDRVQFHMKDPCAIWLRSDPMIAVDGVFRPRCWFYLWTRYFPNNSMNAIPDTRQSRLSTQVSGWLQLSRSAVVTIFFGTQLLLMVWGIRRYGCGWEFE